MIACRACASWIDDAVATCPHCGMPNALARRAGGWLSFQGRISAREFWLWYALPIGLIDLASGFVDAAANAGGVLDGLATIATLFASIAGGTKRLHDRDRSGWFQLVMLIPMVGWIWVFVEITWLRGTRGPNRYGPDPLTVSRR